MNRKKIILLIAHKDYQPIEYGVTREILANNKSLEVLTASTKSGTATATDSSTTQVDITVDQLDTRTIDGLFLIGGAGALDALDAPKVHALLKEMMDLQKPYGSICISSRILAKAGVLGGKKATGWDGDHALADIFRQHAVTYTQEQVTVDGNIVTAAGPDVADKFAWKIIKVLENS